MKTFDAIILGGGPAGFTAGIYLARGKKDVVILDTGTLGGQVNLSHAIANYPGFDEIAGYQLARNMKKQAKSFGCVIRSSVEISSIDLSGDMKQVVTSDETYQARIVIIAAGGSPRTLNLESEDRLRGKGISYCATCDGDFFQDQEIVVVGGGNSALEEAVSLTQYASRVTIVHQFDHFQAYAHAVEEVEANDKIEIILESEVEEFLGEDGLTGVRIKNMNTGETSEIKATGAFIFIGYVPNSEMFKDHVALNENGEITTDELCRTSVEGVYAAGDVREKRYRQITTAVSDGTIAALTAMEHLSMSEE